MAAAPRVVVVGSGMAGAAAAISAARALPRGVVEVLEKENNTGGTSLMANSGINALTPEQGDSADVFKADTIKSGGGHSKEELVDTLVEGSSAAMAFLSECGVRLGSVFQTGGQSVKRTHSTAPGQPAVDQAIMAALQGRMRELGNVRVQSGVKVVGLEREGSEGGWRLTTLAQPAAGGGSSGREGELPGSARQGQQAQRQERHADAVVLATGGFAASAELLRRYAPCAADLGTTNGPWAAGDGLALGQQAGAAAVDLEYVQLNPTGIVDPRDPTCRSKSVAPEKLRGLGAILVNGQGQRFVNELSTRDEVAGAILRQPSRQAVLLFGPQTAADFGPALDSEYLQHGLISRADNAEQLAAQAGLPAGQLTASIQAYGQAAQAGRDSFGKTAFPDAIDPAQPLYWTRVTPVSHYCMGGLAIDSSARVLDGPGRPIPGLFAAGEVAGGVHGKNLLVGNSLLECIVFGRTAGAGAAAHATAERSTG